MHPIAFHLFGRPVYWYGIMAAAGFMAGLVHWNLLARRAGQPRERPGDIALWIMIGGLVGARLLYVLVHIRYFADHPAEILRVDHGGLIFYGGVAGAVVAVIALARRKRTPLWPLGDYAVSALPLGHAFGRIGCFLNGCCHGHPVEGHWPAVRFPAESAAAYLYGRVPVHPVQLYEAGANLVLYGALLSLWFLPRRFRAGMLVAGYAAGYGLIRFGVEFLRGDERLRHAGLTTAQWASLLLIVTAVGIWRFMIRGHGNRRI